MRSTRHSTTSRQPTAERASNRAFTLFELLVAIAVLVALAAIALPRIDSELDARSFDAAMESITAHLLLARAEAQATGRLIEVVYVPDDRRGAHLEARAFDLNAASLTFDAAGDDGESPADATAIVTGDDVDDAERLLPEPWAYRRMPDDVYLDRAAPRNDAEDRGRSVDASAESAATGALRLAVFVPDGSTLIAEPSWLHGPGRRARHLVVNPWTGLPRFDAVDTSDALDDDDPSGADDADDASVESQRSASAESAASDPGARPDARSAETGSAAESRPGAPDRDMSSTSADAEIDE